MKLRSSPFFLVNLMLLLLILFTSCTLGPQEFGVLEGQVNIGPLVPVMREGEEAPTPAPEVYAAREIVVTKKNGRTEFARLQLDSTGWYQVELPVGTYVIDIVTTRGKGQLGAIQLFEDWFLKYGLTHWVYEDNMAKQDFFTRPDLIKVKAKYGLTIEKHTTGNEKRDPEVGISSMAPWYHTGMFILPYGNAASVKMTKMLLSQLQLWTTDGLMKGATVTDIKMASWFPFVRRLVRWDRKEKQARLELTSDQSYPDLDGNMPSWGFTDYGIYGGG